MKENNNKPKQKRPTKRLYIDKIIIEGYKCFPNYTELELKPLTILAGANSSGKTSIMQPLLLMKQTLLSEVEPLQPLLLDGPNVKFSSAREMKSIFSDSNAIKFGFVGKDKTKHIQSFVLDDKDNIKLSEFQFIQDNNVIKLSLDMQEDDAEQFFKRYNSGVFLGFTISKKEHSERKGWKIRSRHFSLQVSTPISRDDENVERLTSQDRIPRSFVKSDPDLWSMRKETLAGFRDSLSSIIHIPGYRGNAYRAYQLAKYSYYGSPGVFNDYWAGLVFDWQNNGDTQELQKLKGSMKLLSLGSNLSTVQVRQSIEVTINANVKNKRKYPYDAWVNVADVGFGVSQVMPVIVSLIAAVEGQIVYVEQPELHLHPKAQHLLASLIVDAVNRGVVVVAETHSDMLIIGILEQIAKKKLEPEKLGLNWFEKNKDGSVQIDLAKVDDKGTYGDWPIDFDEVRFKAQLSHLKATSIL